ncbi:SDR family NAD(P)-dependent oxidoreductase [Lysinibacillus xylanilyticus]|uniref:Short-chain dehydrogenase n=2 Tax=Lysinibacillus xylanilyticus TaxID=582475 RepID=A0A2M9Q528_9BACI|nr:SDR family NAD(P)-dependent oxidoreductase [Lysinibacillus xylanilyticus]PJO43175.1 short-chain dehydrogenase [Lysinibacillus xylanilyticus]
MKHWLVIGGTGMLKDVSVWLINEGNHVTVIGRQQKKMQNLINEAKNASKLTPLLVDYTNYNNLKTALIKSRETHGSFDCIIAWIHGSDKKVWESLFQAVSNTKNVILYHIKGSSSYLNNDSTKSYIPSNIIYREVKLGFIIEDNNTSRWLTNSEIAQGTIDAIKQEIPEKRVGVFEPWNLRP